MGHGMITTEPMNLIPPETTTPMPPTLIYCYEKSLGWPGRPEDYKPVPKKIRFSPVLAFGRRYA